MITSVQISGKYLLVTMNTDEGEGTLKFTDYSNIANMTMQYSNINKEKGELYQVLSDKLNYNVTDTTKSSLSGTIFDDVINLADAQYVPIGKKNIKNNTGVTINTGTGNDTITGTKYNDTITGGADINTINIDVTKNFGNDTYKLTKGEKLNIKTTGEGTVSYDKDKKGNIIVTAKNTESETTGTLTITGLAKKDTTQGVTINGQAITFDFDEDNIAKNKITGTAQNDEIDIKDLDGLTKTVGKGKNKQTVDKTSEDAGITISSGTGNDTITGSKYSDTITGGAGENTIKILNTAFGNDTINLTKGEKLTLDMSAYNDINSVNDLKGKVKVSGKNLVITTDNGTLTLKNFAKSNVVNNGFVKVKLNNGQFVDLNVNEVLAYTSSDFSKNDKKKTATFTGSRFGETITDDATLDGYTKTINTGNGINTVNVNSSGKVTVNGGSGVDNITIDGQGTHIVKTGAGENTVTITGKGVATITGGADKDTIRVYNNDSNTTINAGNGNNVVYIQGSTAKNIVTAGSGADTITLATNADDITSTVNAGNGQNTIGFEGKGNNTIISGKDNDTINVWTGTTNTTIKAGKGENAINISNGSTFGNITLTEEKVNAKNIINFRAEINENYTLIKSGNDLIIQNDINDSKIKIQGYYLTRTSKTKYAEIELKINGTSKTVDELLSLTGKGLTIGGSGTIVGTQNADNILANDYDTTLKASNDIITAGKGNDTINAGQGKNTIKFNVGDGADIIEDGGGTDTLVFAKGVNVKAEYNENDLIISYGVKNSSGIVEYNDTITLTNYTPNHSVQNIQIGTNKAKAVDSFLPQPETLKVGEYNIIQGTDNADNITGTTSSDKIFGGKGNDTLNGNSGNDYLYGGAGNDKITGGKGSDWLFGGSGSNKFYFNAGDGNDYMNETSMDNTLVFKNITDLSQLQFTAENRSWDGYYLDNEFNRHDYYKYDLKISYSASDSVILPSFFSVQNYDFSTIKLQAGENGEAVTLYSMIKENINELCPEDSSYPDGLKDIQTNFNTNVVAYLNEDKKYNNLDLTVTGYGNVYTNTGNDKIYFTTEGANLGATDYSKYSASTYAGNDFIDSTGLTERDEEYQWVSVANSEGINTVRCVVEKVVGNETQYVLNSPVNIHLDYRIESNMAFKNTRAIEERWGDDENKLSITAFRKGDDLILANNSLQGIYGGTTIVEDYYKLSAEEQAKVSVSFYPVQYNDPYEPGVSYSIPDFLTHVLNNENYIPVNLANLENEDLQEEVSQTKRFKTKWFNLIDNTDGAQGAEIIGNGAKDNYIVGGASATSITGGNGNDIIYAGDITGHDENGNFIPSNKETGVTINGGGGHDYIIGGAGNDILNGTKGQNYINGGDGNDTIIGGDLSELNNNYGYYKYVNNELIGGKGNDIIYSVTENQSYQGGTTYFENYIEGNEGNDTIYANGYRDVVYSGSGDDIIHSWKISSGTSEGRIFGEEGNNRIYLYGDGYQVVEVGNGNNTIDTTQSTGKNGIITGNGNNTILGGNGEDIITAGYGVNTINAGGGNDTILVYGDGSTVDGGDGNDTITAYGTTTVNGGDGDDTIYINNGDHGSVSNLIINGGDGNDSYVVGAYGTNNYDTIVASSGKDVIKLTAFTNATTYQNGNDLVIVYNHKDANYDYSNTSSLILKDYYVNNGANFANFSIQLYSDNYGRILTNKFSVSEFISYANYGTDIYRTDGTPYDDKIKSSGTINAQAGNDFIIGIAKNSQIINAGNGNNEVIAQAKENTITGGTGDDYYCITGGVLNDNEVLENTITDEGGNNTIYINRQYNTPAKFNITLNGDGNNTITTGEYGGIFVIETGNGKQNIDVRSVNWNENITSVTTGSGDDNIRIAQGNVNSGAGNDTISVYGKGGTINGGAGDDTYIIETGAYSGSSTEVSTNTLINDNSGSNNIKLTSESLIHEDLIFMMNVKADGTVGNFMFDNEVDGGYNACILGKGDINNAGSQDASYIWAQNLNEKGYIRISSINNISKIEDSNGYYIDTATINTVKENVAGWLSEQGYADVQEALAGENQWTHPNLTTLAGADYFGGMNWQQQA